MKREGGRVLLDLSEEEFQSVLQAIGIAGGQALQQGMGVGPYFWPWLRLANTVNVGNPQWTPYEVERALTDPDAKTQ